MSEQKSPAFQLYPNEFLGSGRVAAMELDEIGAYTILLCYDWNEGGLPNDMKILARWCRATPRQFSAIWPAVKENFVLKQGRWYNPRLEREREKQATNREKKRQAAGARWHDQPALALQVHRSNGTGADANDDAHALQVECLSSSIAVASSPSDKKQKHTASEKTSPFPKSVCDALYETWISVRGQVQYSAFRKALQPLFPASGPRYTLEQLTEAIKANAEWVEGLSPREAGFENLYRFAGDIVRWVRLGAMPAIDPMTRQPTERGQLA